MRNKYFTPPPSEKTCSKMLFSILFLENSGGVITPLHTPLDPCLVTSVEPRLPDFFDLPGNFCLHIPKLDFPAGGKEVCRLERMKLSVGMQVASRWEVRKLPGGEGANVPAGSDEASRRKVMNLPGEKA